MRKVLAGIAFAAVVLSVWAAGHVYLAHRLLIETDVAEPMRALALAAMIALASLPLLQPIAERTVSPRVGRLIAWPGYVWMGFAFFLIVFFGLTNLSLLLVAAAAVRPEHAAALGWARAQAVIVVALAASATVVGLVAGLRLPAVRRLEIRLARWPGALDGFRIVQISDLHIGALLDRRFARTVVDAVNALRPDLIAVTGDLVDGSVALLAEEVAPFAELRSRHGSYFVTGNHDYYSGVDPWLGVIAGLGMRILRNERVTIEQRGTRFDLAGVDDHRASLFGGGHGEDVPRALAGREPGRPLILLAHDPTTFHGASKLGIDLQLSGHTHGGQIWPFGAFVRLAVGFVAGHYARGDAQLYVSRGTGFWGPPMRLRAPAEITEIVLRSACGEPQRDPLAA
jgi:uncharacterized protein